MADDILSQFLVRIAYQQDDKSRQKFDEGLKQVQTRAAEFGAKIGELPTIVSEATKRISSSLSEMYYSAQKNGATARELDALRYAAKQSGEGADRAEASFNAFSQRIRDFATGASRQYKQMFGVDVDPNHTLDAFIKVREKIEELRNAGGPQNLSRANMLARTFGIDEDALVSGRMAIFKKAWLEEAKRNEGIAADKAVALTRSYNALAAALETVARKADAALFDKFGAVLDRLTKWLDEDSERIVQFFTDLAAQIGFVFTDLSKLSPAFTLLWDALKEVGGWLQKIIGQPDSGGLAGVRHLLEIISGVVMARFVASMVLGFAAAFAPLTALLAALAALGVVGVGAYTAGEAVRGWLGGGTSGGEFGPGEGMAAGGHGTARRGRFGHGDGGRGADLGKEGWWTPERQKHAYDKLRAGGLSDMGAKGLISRWVNVESTGGPASENAIGGGHFGIGQWSRARGSSIWGNTDFDTQLDLVVKESKSVAEAIAGRLLRDAKTPEEGARAATSYERAEHYNKETHIDDWTAKTLRGIERVEKAIGEAGKAPATGQDVIPGQSNPHKPGFDPSSIPFHHTGLFPQDLHQRLASLVGKPLGSDLHSMNQVNDYRSVDNDVNINIASDSPRDLTARPLGRPRNADLIRNTASYAA